MAWRVILVRRLGSRESWMGSGSRGLSSQNVHCCSRPSMNLDFPQALLVLGALLASAAALSGWLRASVLSISVLAVAAGIVMAAFDVVSDDPTSNLVKHVVELALI